MNRGLQFAVFAITGTTAFINVISNAEGEFNSGAITEAERNAAIALEAAKINPSQLTLFGGIIICTILACTIAAYVLVRFCFKIDEKKEEQIVTIGDYSLKCPEGKRSFYAFVTFDEQIVKELEIRHKEDEEKASASD